jgi:hypothetical protein
VCYRDENFGLGIEKGAGARDPAKHFSGSGALGCAADIPLLFGASFRTIQQIQEPGFYSRYCRYR